MPLSEHEQRILDEIERRLAAEDPKFARATTLPTTRDVAVRRVKRAGVGFVAGLCLLLIGLFTGLRDANLLFAFGLAGFAVMLASLLLVAKASKHLGKESGNGDASSWFTRAEERWRKRFERGENGS